MKRIRTADGGLLFLEDGGYMPKLVAYLRETAGNDAAELVEEWAEEQVLNYAEVLGRADGARYAAEEKARRAFEEMRDERDEHLREIEELETELERVAERNEALAAVNEYLTDLLNNPEKLFYELGTEVYRYTERETLATERGRILAYKLRMDSRTGKPEFFVRIKWENAGISWSKFKSIGKAIHICAEDDEA
jgi:hypothetical protein